MKVIDSIFGNPEKKFKVGRFDSVRDAYDGSPWMFKLVCRICDLFGVPSTSGECMSKEDRIMYICATGSVIAALEEYPVLWLDGFETYDIDILAENFALAYNELTGKDVVDLLDDISYIR